MSRAFSSGFDPKVLMELQARTIIETAMDGVISTDIRQNIILFNFAAETIFAYKADEVLGQPLDLLMPDRFQTAHRQHVQAFEQNETTHRRMAQQRLVFGRRSNGEEFPIEASISRAAVQGELIFTAIVRDVSEMVRHQCQIEQQSQILDQVSDAVSAIDLNDNIIFWNQGANRLFGWSKDEILGQSFQKLVHADHWNRCSLINDQCNASNTWAGELLRTTQSGKILLVEHRRTALRDKSGFVYGHICVDADITDRRKKQQTELRRQRLESIGTLAGGVAHDLNNVLTPILMGTKLLASGKALLNPRALLETMEASANRGAALVRQLLAFAGGMRGDRSQVIIEELIEDTRAFLEHTLPKSIRIETKIEPNTPPVLGNPTELSQVLMNLCINARDAMPNGGLLSMEARPIQFNGQAGQLHPDAHTGPYVVFSIADTGTGMSPEVLDRAFDPFFTTKEMGKGTGVGLATVQGIVKSHNGFIMVYSELGQGSKFSIYLPAAREFESIKKSVEETSRQSGENRTILLVDDEPFVLTTTSMALESAGYRVLASKDGQSAIEIFTANPHAISCVILDIMMPGLDGPKTLAELRRVNDNVAVIASSGLQTAERESEMIGLGAKAFLPKPYSEEQLLRTLALVFDKSV